ncbi:MAG: helix-turn-helix transcriptional regulator [Anaerolineae bacterium]|nr:helix-turn-helix transcriptional regulator [Anaerolineae bacterium]MDW8173357.1 helix-turn-helix transcriptional regulator [Anaerolineae bacterium]
MQKRVLKNRLLLLIQAREQALNRRIKLKDLADFVGVTHHTVTSWIRNEVRKYEAHIIEGFCDYFNCDIGDLLYFEWVDVEAEDQT